MRADHLPSFLRFQMFGWRSAGDFLLYCLFVGGFVGTLAFFSLVDVYDKHFFQSSYAAIYNAFRLIFATYFFWLVYVVGRQALSFVAPRRSHRPAAERKAGAGLLRRRGGADDRDAGARLPEPVLARRGVGDRRSHRRPVLSALRADGGRSHVIHRAGISRRARASTASCRS